MCAIFGVFNVPRAAYLTSLGLDSLQHRGGDSAGIAATNGSVFNFYRASGTVRQAIPAPAINNLIGHHALGHVRYSTSNDDPACFNVQPIIGKWKQKRIAIAHNGNITNTDDLARIPDLKLDTSMDTEYILRLLEKNDSLDHVVDGLLKVLPLVRGSYCLGILTPNVLIAIRDHSGNRPLSIGKLGSGHCITSETCAYPTVEATHVSDVEPGTMVVFEKRNRRFTTVEFSKGPRRICSFENPYFSHPCSRGVTEYRLALGRKLEECAPVKGADIVTPVPDSANFIAQGYAESGRSGKLLQVIQKHTLSSRSFIKPTQIQRVEEIERKFMFTADQIEGKIIVIVDDSMVRGTTHTRLISKVRRRGAKGVHLRLACPQIFHICRYGIATRLNRELISTQFSEKQIRGMIGADSVAFMPLEAFMELTGDPSSHCFACMNGEYWHDLPAQPSLCLSYR